MRIAIATAAAVFVLSVAATSLGADELASARREFARGQGLFAAGDYLAAAEAYRRSYELSHRPGLLFNLAQALRLGGELEAAASAYRAFLAGEPGDPELTRLARLHLEAVERRIEPPAPEAAPPARLHFPTAPLEAPEPARAPAQADVQVQVRSPDRAPLLAGGALLGVAVDARARAASLLAGAAVELGSRIELSAAAILGATRGVYGGAALFIGHGPVRPLVAAGMPVFFADEVVLGVRGAAGLAWSPSRHLMIAAEIGVERFASPPAGLAPALVVPAVRLRGSP